MSDFWSDCIIKIRQNNAFENFWKCELQRDRMVVNWVAVILTWLGDGNCVLSWLREIFDAYMHSFNMWVSNTIKIHPYNKPLWSYYLFACRLFAFRPSLYPRARTSGWALSLNDITSLYSHILYPNVELHSLHSIFVSQISSLYVIDVVSARLNYFYGPIVSVVTLKRAFLLCVRFYTVTK